MQQHIRQWLGRSITALAVMTAAAGCSQDTPLDPDPRSAMPVTPAAALQGVDLGSCGNLKAPEGHRISARLFARGAQIYRWDGAAWVFVAPAAELFEHRQAARPVGTHYAGPTWESRSGSKVTGSVMDRCTPDASAIPWLLLAATPTEGPGIFRKVTHIQRINTVAGKAPATPGTTIGELAHVPYTTDYIFYRAR